MVYLLLAIASSASITLMLRAFDGRIRSEMTMFTGNYAACAILSVIYMGRFPEIRNGFSFALWLGILTGLFFLGAFLLLKKSLQVNGVALSSTFMKMGVLVPTLMAILFFGEKLTGWKLAGFIIALAAIVLLKMEKDGSGAGKHFALLICLLLVGGMADAFSNIYERLGQKEYADVFLLFTFLVALILAGIPALRERKLASFKDLLYGALIGLPNYYSSRFLLFALRKLPAVTVYPVYSISVLVLITLGGAILFKEHLNNRKRLAIFLILAALVLLNLQIA